MDKYEIIIYWSEEDKVFVEEVPELPGCMAHGDTQEVALANTKDAIQLWIDTALVVLAAFSISAANGTTKEKLGPCVSR